MPSLDFSTEMRGMRFRVNVGRAQRKLAVALRPSPEVGEFGAGDEAFRSQLLARARAAQSANEAAGWLNFISEIGTGDGVRVAFETTG